MKKIFKRIFAGIIAVAAIAFITYTMVAGNRTKFYDDAGTTGNTSGNLLNGGLFCENEGKIYFANPYDENKLYCMDSDLSNAEKLIDDRASYINSAGSYIFYTRRNDQIKNDVDALLSISTTGLFRASTSGHNVKRLYDDPAQVICLYGNDIFYQHYDQKKGLELYSVKIDGNDNKKLLNEPAAPYALHNDKIYYTGWNKDHYIHSLGTSGSGSQVIYAGNCTNLARQGSYLYFMDMEQDYSLCRVTLDGSSVETLINKRLATYNISEDGTTVFYQVDNGTENGLYKLELPTMETNLIAEGDYNYLNLTSEYLFYETFDQDRLFIYNLATGQTQQHTIEKSQK